MSDVKLAAAIALSFVLFATPAEAYQNPQLGRFMQRDPQEFTDGLNLSEYEKSNFLRQVDPSGTRVVPFGFVAFIHKRHGSFIKGPLIRDYPAGDQRDS